MAAAGASGSNGHAGGGKLRYRRKVPTSGKSGASAAGGTEDNQQETEAAAANGKRLDAVEDNQREHEELAAVAPMTSGGNQGRDGKKSKKKHKPKVPRDDKAPSPANEVANKKEAARKPKRVHGEKIACPEGQSTHGKDAVEMHREPEAATVGDGVLMDTGSGALAPVKVDAVGSSVDTRAQAQHHKESNGEKHTRTQSHLKEKKTSKRQPKTLQWKVKATQPAAQADDASALTNRLEATKDLKKKETVDDEEADFAARERQALKLRAKSLSFPIESSSQETQSGSDDDSATFIQFSGPLAPLPSVALHTEVKSERLLEAATEDLHSLDAVCFPMPLPLEQIAAVTPARVHQVLISDFAFHPSEMQVDAGDVVVWRVSEQTPGMVEHCLDVTLTRTSDASCTTASTSTLSAGDKFTWRFADAGAATVSCSVYDVHGSIIVNAHTSTAQAPTPVPVELTVAKRKRAKTKKQKKNKRKSESTTTKGPASPQHAVDASAELNTDSGGDSGPVEIFHSSPDLRKHGGDSDMDAGLCDAVLSQLGAVANSAIVGVNASSGNVLPMIVVGDVACPIVEDVDKAAEEEEETAPDTEEDNNAVDEVSDFQERVIAMLKRSEETQAEHRRSFAVDGSSFDALTAYDFFKRRFTTAQSSCERVVYF